MVWLHTSGMKIDFSILDGFDWDQNNLEHIKKHNVEFSECEEVFVNRPFLINEDLEHSSKAEVRFQVLGRTDKGRKVFLSFTIRNKRVRVISARDQNRKERRDYAKEA